MGNRNRHRRGDFVQREYAVDSAEVIEQGDMLYCEADDARPMSSCGWDTSEEAGSEAYCRTYVASRFAGVALDASASGKTDAVRAASGPDAVFEFVCESATFEIGDLFGPAGVDTPKNLADQILLKVNDPRQAIAVAVERAGSAATTVLVKFLTSAERATLLSTVHTITLPAVALTATSTILENFNFKRRVRILDIQAIVTTLVAADSVVPVISLYKVAQVLDDTLSFAEGDAVGAVVEQAIDDASGDDVFEAETDFDVKVTVAAVDSGSAAGAAQPVITYCDLGPNK